MGTAVRVIRLRPGQTAEATAVFAMMARVFDEGDDAPLPSTYVDGLLVRRDFWALAAIDGTEIVGGLTAHTLPMTRSVASELFIYDLAVPEDRQRRGIGRLLIAELRSLARAEGIANVFVPADDEDQHAIDFYTALGGEAAPVTMFTFDDGVDET